MTTRTFLRSGSAAFLAASLIGPRILFAADGDGAPPAAAPPAAAPPAAAQPPAAAPPAGAPPSSTATAAWYDAPDGPTGKLTPEQRTFLAGKGFADLPTAITSAMESDRLVRDRNVLPKPDPQKLMEWEGWAQLGWNPDRNAYAVKDPQVPADFQRDQGFEKRLVDIAHENRLPVAAAQKLVDGVTAHLVEAVKQNDARGAREDAELTTKLKADWGGDYDRNRELAQRAARYLAPGLDASAEMEKAIGSPALMQLFHKIGTMLGEDKLVAGQSGGGSSMSTSQVDAELARQAGDPEFMKAFGDVRHPRHADVRAQRDQLLARKAKIATVA